MNNKGGLFGHADVADLLTEGSTRFTSGICAPAASPWPDFLKGQEMSPVRVLLVDGDELARKAIAQELDSDIRIRLEGQGSGVKDGRRLLWKGEFDVLMLDVRLVDGTGFDLIPEARRRNVNCEIIVVSLIEDETHVMRAFELGAIGYLLKNAWFQSFPEAVLQVVNGGAAITPRLMRNLLGQLRRGQADNKAPPHATRSSMLSNREREILTLIAAGHGSRAIGAKLAIGTETVNTHIKGIYRKLCAHSRAQAVSLATRQGLI